MANDPSASDEIISLEDLVKDDTGTSTGESLGQSPSQAGGGPGNGPGNGPDGGEAAPAEEGILTGDAIDDILTAEDPGFAASLEELKAEGLGDAELDLDASELDGGADGQRRPPRPSGWRGFPYRALDFLLDRGVSALLALKEGAVEGAEWLKGQLLAILALPRSSKLMILAVIALGSISVLTAQAVLKGSLLPTLKAEYLHSFAVLSDEAFEFGPDEPFDDFADPLFHPEHVVEFGRLVVNLRARREGRNPMGLFEFYIESSSQEGAIELRDREIEVRDLMSRTIEQMPYDELATAPGKNKLKIMIRQNLNSYLTKGRVRRVYYKNVVLKP